MSEADRPPATLGAVVLSGGTGRRMGGVDKASIEIDGITLLELAIRAVAEAGAEEIVVVGEEVPTSRPVTFRREDPPSGGPAAGLLAGLDGFAVRPARVLVLAVDMPRVTAATFRRLLALDAEAVWLIDGAGRSQFLCAAYDVAALDRVAPTDPHGLPMRRLVADLDQVQVAALPGEAADIDSWRDLRDLAGSAE